MKKRLSIILCIALALCMIPTTFSFAKTVKPKSVSIAPKSMVLAVGDIVQLTATKKPAKASGKLTWSTSDKKIATVSSKGVVKGISQGTATITVKTTNKKTAKCKVVVKAYATKTELYGSFTEKLKSIFVTKEELSSFATKDDISALPTKEDFSSFATKDDVTAAIGKDTYTKSEIDDKLNALPSGGGDSCGCTVKTNNDVVNILNQNTYTKDEIDSKIAGDDWEDGAEVPCINKNTFPKTFVSTKNVRDNNYDISITINDVSCKKYKVMDYVTEGDSEHFVPYKYVFTVSYIIDGYEAYYQAYRDAYEEYDLLSYPLVSIGVINDNEPLVYRLDHNNTEQTFTHYSNDDYTNIFLFEAAVTTW